MADPLLRVPARLRVGRLAIFEDAAERVHFVQHELPAVVHSDFMPTASGGTVQLELRLAADPGEREMARAALPSGAPIEPVPWEHIELALRTTDPEPVTLSVGSPSCLGEQRLVANAHVSKPPRGYNLVAVLQAPGVIAGARASVSSEASAVELADRLKVFVEASDGQAALGQVLLGFLGALSQQRRLRLGLGGDLPLHSFEQLGRLIRLELAARLRGTWFPGSSLVTPVSEAPLDLTAPAPTLAARWDDGDFLTLRMLQSVTIPGPGAADVAPPPPKPSPRRVTLRTAADFPWGEFFFVRVAGDPESPETVRAAGRPPAFEATLSAGETEVIWTGAPAEAHFWADGGHHLHGHDLRLPSPEQHGDLVVINAGTPKPMEVEP